MTGLGGQGGLSGVPLRRYLGKVGMQTRRFFPERATIFPFPRAAKLGSLCHSRPARRTSIGKVALDSMLQTRPMHAAVRYSDRSDHSPHVHASCGRDFGFDSDELDLFSVRLLKAPVRLAWDYRDSRHRQ